MPTDILMPALSPTMEEGKLAKWLVKEGDEVSSGDIIAEIETDKATMEVEAVDEGTVGKHQGGRGHRGREGEHRHRSAGWLTGKMPRRRHREIVAAIPMANSHPAAQTLPEVVKPSSSRLTP
jgi:hypothetical protein